MKNAQSQKSTDFWLFESACGSLKFSAENFRALTWPVVLIFRRLRSEKSKIAARVADFD